MFLDNQSYVRDGRTYRRVLLRNSYRQGGKVRHDVIGNLSKASDEEINAIAWALKHKRQLPGVTEGDAKVTTKQGLSVGSVWLLYQLSKRTGIVQALGKGAAARQALWMVMATVIGFRSRLSVVRAAQRYAACDIVGLDAFNEDDLYDSLDWLDEHQAEIEQKLFRRRYGGQKPTLYLYDVTSSYLEGEQNEYGAYGYDRDKKKGKKQIVVGLLTDQEGWPIACQVFKGNTQDPKTVLSQVRKLANRFQVEQVTFVGDRGMIKSGQVEDLNDQHFHYITALTKPQIRSLLKKGILQMSLFDETVEEVRDGDLRYVLRRNPVRAEEVSQNREEKLMKFRALVTERNEYLGAHPKAQVEVALRKARRKAQALKISGWADAKAEGRCLKAEIDNVAKDQEASLDGCYVIKSDLDSEQADKETLHTRYKDLAEVEWAFRTMKTVMLELRGIFVRKAGRTRAHVFVVMLAYMLVYQLRRAWDQDEVTVEEGLDELSQICSIEVHRSAHASCQTVPVPRPSGAQLLKRVGITLPDAIPCRGITVVTRKKLVPERRNNVNS